MSGETEEVKLLREILKYTKFAGMGQVKGVLETVLNIPKKRLGYQLSDGTRGVREVVQLSGMADVSEAWKEWKQRGLGDTISVRRAIQAFL
jgi:hypothetical protein